MFKTQPMVGIGIAFLVSLLGASFLLPTLRMGAILLCLLVAVGLLIGYRKKHMCVIMTLAVVVLGIGLYTVKTNRMETVVTQLAGQEQIVTATVKDCFTNKKGTHGYDVLVTQCKGKTLNTSFRARLYSMEEQSVQIGDKVTWKVELLQPQNTDVFQTQEYYQSQQIYFTGFLKKAIIAEQPQYRPLGYWLKKSNDFFSEKVEVLFQPQEASVIEAMVLGNRENISLAVARDFSQSGIYHIIAISGLHLTIISGMLLWLLRKIGLRHGACQISTIAVIWIFIGIAGFPISGLRSGIMLTVLLAGGLFGRPASSLNSLFVSAILLGLGNPFVIHDIGFQMTFLSCLGLFLCGKPISLWLQRTLCGNKKRVILRGACEITAMSLATMTFLFPVFVSHFNGISVAGILANLIVIPIMPLLLGSGLATLLIGSVSVLVPFAEIVAVIPNVLTQFVLLVAKWIAEIPFGYIGVGYWGIKAVLLVGSCLLAGCVLLWKKRRKQILLCGMAALAISGIFFNVLEWNKTQVTTISSYEGQAICIQKQGKAMIVQLATDEYLYQQLVAFADSRNIKTVEHYILLDETTKPTEGLEYLLMEKSVESVVLSKQTQGALYLAEKYPQISQTFDFPMNVSLGNDHTLMVSMEGETKGVWADFYGRRFCITSDALVAQNAKCEFLFFGKEKTQQIKHFYAKYVIMLNECEFDGEAPASRLLFAQKQRYTVSLFPKGKAEVLRE